LKYTLAEIQWDDAATDHGWQQPDEIEPHVEMALTVGFVVKETADHVVIASTVGEDGSCNGRIQIPKKMIRKRRIIRKAK
jgi:hypothetical protein